MFWRMEEEVTGEVHTQWADKWKHFGEGGGYIHSKVSLAGAFFTLNHAIRININATDTLDNVSTRPWI